MVPEQVDPKHAVGKLDKGCLSWTPKLKDFVSIKNCGMKETMTWVCFSLKSSLCSSPIICLLFS